MPNMRSRMASHTTGRMWATQGRSERRAGAVVQVPSAVCLSCVSSGVPLLLAGHRKQLAAAGASY